MSPISHENRHYSYEKWQGFCDVSMDIDNEKDDQEKMIDD